MSDADSLPPPDYETEDAHPRWVAAIAGAMALFVGMALVVGLFYRRGAASGRAAPPIPGPDAFFQNGPRAKTSVERSWDDLDRDLSAEGDGYGWIDRRAGIVRIPVDRAIDLVCAEQGAGKTGRAAERSRAMRRFRAAVAIALLASGTASAADAGNPAGVGFEQRIGGRLPLDAIFTGADGRTAPLASYFGGKPVVLIFNYFRCPELCSLVTRGATDTLRQLSWTVGKDYVLLSVSIDPTDTPEMARSRRDADLLRYGRTGASVGWHTLVGRPDQIEALTAAAGFHYAYDSRSRQYAHPSGLVVVTPKGIVSSYFLGIDFSADRMDSALRRAAANRTGSSVFSLVFLCFQGSSAQGRYGGLIWRVLWVGVLLTVAGVFGSIGWMLWDEQKAAPWPRGGAMTSVHTCVAWDALPPQASEMAARVDAIFDGLLIMAIAVVVILGALTAVILVRYRRGSSASRKRLGIATWKIETAWTLATLAVFLFFFVRGAAVYTAMERVPAGAEEIDVVGRQWMWDVRHPDGRREFDELHVQTGVPVRLVLSSEDVIHSFFVPAFRMKQDVVPGRIVNAWFKPTRAGVYRLFCAQFCGTAHAEMSGRIVVLDAPDYAAWRAGRPAAAGATPPSAGKAAYDRYGCAECHDDPAGRRAPPLRGLYGRPVRLDDGRTVVADEQYLRDAILLASKRRVAGYPPIMPTYDGQITEAEALALVAYLKSLPAGAAGTVPLASVP